MPPGESHSGTPLAGINHEDIVRYEPNKGFIADGVPDFPVGTPDELQAHGLPATLENRAARTGSFRGQLMEISFASE